MTRRIGCAAAAVAALMQTNRAGRTEDRRLHGSGIGGEAGAALGSPSGAGPGRILATGIGAVVGSVAGAEIADRRQRRR